MQGKGKSGCGNHAAVFLVTAKVAKAAKKKRGMRWSRFTIFVDFAVPFSRGRGETLEVQLGMGTEMDQAPKLKGIEADLVL